MRHIISDLGATLGKTGNSITHNRNSPKDYAHGKLVKNVEGNKLLFDFHASHDNILSNVTVADAKWMGQILSKLSDRQISDAFRAANYSAEEVDVLTKTFRARIDELANLPG